MFQGKIHHFEFMLSAITVAQVILSSWNLVWVSFWGWEIQKLHLKDLKINHPLKILKISGYRYLLPDQYQKHSCGWIDNWKKFFFFCRYQPIIEPKMGFGSLLGSSKWCYKFSSFWNIRNLLLIDCIIVYCQKISKWDF